MSSSPSPSEIPSTPTVLDRRTAGPALMFVAVHGPDLSLSSSWTKVDTPPNLPKANNVSPVIFDYGVTITQRLKRYRCTLALSPYQYTDAVVIQGQVETDPITIIMKCTGDYQMLFEGDEEAARQLPLARLCHDELSFDYIKLSIQPSKFMDYAGLETEGTEGRNAHLRILLSGQDLPDIDRRWNLSLAARTRSLLKRKKKITTYTKSLPTLSGSKSVAEDTVAFAPLDRPIATDTMTLATLERTLLQIQKLKHETIPSLEKENEEFLQAQEQKLQELRIMLQEKVKEALSHIENAETRVKSGIQSLRIREAILG